MLEDTSRHMRTVQAALEHLAPRLNSLMANVVNNSEAAALEVGREAGRLEQVLSEFVDGYLEVKASRGGPDSNEARTLVMGVYRHHARSICRWLEEVAWVTSNPEAVIQQRGLEGSADVILTVSLNMTTPPQMAALHLLSEHLRESLEAPNVLPPQGVDLTEPRALGVLETIGALAFGVGLTKAILGKLHG
jgi:hypothetical protein